jgi:hypothetical protein
VLDILRRAGGPVATQARPAQVVVLPDLRVERR